MQNRRRKNELVQDVATEKDGTSISLVDAVALFMRDVRGLAFHTQRWHRENLNALQRVLAKQDIVVDDCCGLTTRFLKDHFIFYMKEELCLKPNTVNGRVRTVRKLIHFLHEEGYLGSDYSASIPLVRAEKVVIATFNENHIERILAQPSRGTFTGLRDYAILLLLLETGMRISELVGIRLPDLRLREYQILVNGKGAKQRLVPVQSKMRQVLQKYLAQRGSAESDALFISLNGNGISKRYVQELIGEYGRRAHIDDVRVSAHTFRHTMAKFYILAGGDIFSLQRILGHSSLEMVRHYVELFANDVQTQHQKFSFVERHL